MFGQSSHFGAENVFQSSIIKIVSDNKCYLLDFLISTVKVNNRKI